MRAVCLLLLPQQAVVVVDIIPRLALLVALAAAAAMGQVREAQEIRHQLRRVKVHLAAQADKLAVAAAVVVVRLVLQAQQVLAVRLLTVAMAALALRQA